MCGQEVTIESPFTKAVLLAPGATFVTCSECYDRTLGLVSGAVADVPPDPAALVPLGRVRVTHGAIALLADRGRHFWEFTARHAAGDWGTVGTAAQPLPPEPTEDDPFDDEAEDNRTNRDAVAAACGTVQSAYDLGPGSYGPTLWVITELAGPGLSRTTVLLPSEY
jgi:hypothetical protein